MAPNLHQAFCPGLIKPENAHSLDDIQPLRPLAEEGRKIAPHMAIVLMQAYYSQKSPLLCKPLSS